MTDLNINILKLNFDVVNDNISSINNSLDDIISKQMEKTFNKHNFNFNQLNDDNNYVNYRISDISNNVLGDIDTSISDISSRSVISVIQNKFSKIDASLIKISENIGHLETSYNSLTEFDNKFIIPQNYINVYNEKFEDLSDVFIDLSNNIRNDLEKTRTSISDLSSIKYLLESSFNKLESNDIEFNGNKMFIGNIDISGEKLKSENNIFIDPKPYGIDDENGKEGTVIIHGGLSVKGSYTSLNSTEVDISDTLITLAHNNNDVNNSGIKIGDNTAHILYNSNSQCWYVSHDISANKFIGDLSGGIINILDSSRNKFNEDIGSLNTRINQLSGNIETLKTTVDSLAYYTNSDLNDELDKYANDSDVYSKVQLDEIYSNTGSAIFKEISCNNLYIGSSLDNKDYNYFSIIEQSLNI